MLLLGTSLESKHFLKMIRTYNSAFRMTSFEANTIAEGGFMLTFKVQRQVYHRIASLQPQINEHPQFLQLYFVGSMRSQAEYHCNTAFLLDSIMLVVHVLKARTIFI